MGSVRQVEVQPDSLLARYGSAQDYRDCFAREVAGNVTLEQFIERFYCSAAFRPERFVLGLFGRGANNADACALARGETDRFAVWKLVERSPTAILLHSKDTGTASWLAVEAGADATTLYFGSWVGNLGQSGWRFMQQAHVMYSSVLLEGAAGTFL